MIGSLFSGIGGLELGLERAVLGPVAWQVEADAYCRHVLARHWPDVPRHDDVRTVGRHNLAPVTTLCGGFPCQDGAGLAGARSGLWFEMERVIDEVRPTFVVVENVAHTWRRWVPFVRGALWRLGYASVPVRVRACDVGARHERARILLVAGPAADVGRVADAAYAHGERWDEGASVQRAPQGRDGLPLSPGGARADGDAADASHDARLGLALGIDVAGDDGQEREAAGGGADGGISPGFGLAPRPWMVRGVHGLPGGVDGPWRRAGWTGARLREARIRALGNAVVPACAEVVGRLIVDAHARGAA